MKSILKNLTLCVIMQMLTFAVPGSNLKQESSKLLDPIEAIDEFNNFYKSGNYYFGGQPSLEAIKWLKSEGVSLIINLRSDKENENFTKEAFNEENMVEELELSYESIPVSYPDSYNPETVEVLIKVLSNHKGKVFIHCAGGGRVRWFFMAYLVKAKNHTLNEAIAFGKQMKFTFLLEELLGKEIKMAF